MGWVGLHPIDRPEEEAIAYLDDHARPGRQRGGGARRRQRDPRRRPRGAVPLPLEPARPGPRRRPGHPGRPARQPEPADLGDRRPPVARRLGARLHHGAGRSSTPTTTRSTTAGKFTIYRRNRAPMTRSTGPRPRPRGRGVRRRAAPLVLAGRHPQRPDRHLAVALAARDLLAARLPSLALVPEGLVAVAAGAGRLRPGRGVTDDLGFTPHVTAPIRTDEWLAHLWGGDTVPTVSLQHALVRRPVPPRRPGRAGTTSPPARPTPRTSWSG